MSENLNENLNNYKTFVVEYFVKLKKESANADELAQTVEKVQIFLGFFFVLWYNVLG